MVTQEQRKRQLAREKFLRQQQRRTSARRKARMRNSVIASVLGVIVIGSVALYTTGVLKNDDDKTNASGQFALIGPTILFYVHGSDSGESLASYVFQA